MFSSAFWLLTLGDVENGTACRVNWSRMRALWEDMDTIVLQALRLAQSPRAFMVPIGN
jgi:hypothetical protein